MKRPRGLIRKTSKAGYSNRRIITHPAFKPIGGLAGQAVLGGFLLLAMFTALTGCAEETLKSAEPEAQEASTKNGEEESFMENEKDIADLAMPPLDQDVPGYLETATLAMG